MKRKILYGVLLVCFCFILGGCNKKDESDTPKGTTIVSNNEWFQLEIPSEYTFIKNPLATNSEMGIYDETNALYIFAYAYQKEDDFKAFVNKKYQYYTDNEYYNLTEQRNIKISGFNTYEFNFTYTDTTNGYDYYSEAYYIDGNDGVYIIYFESLVEDQNEFKDLFAEIIETFEELES